MTHVSMPEAGEFARFAFTLDGCGKLQDRYGRTWRDDTFAGLAELQPDVVAAAIEVALVDGDATKAPWGMPVETVATRLADALSLAMFGRLKAEQDVVDEDALIRAATKIARFEARLSGIKAEVAAGE